MSNPNTHKHMAELRNLKIFHVALTYQNALCYLTEKDIFKTATKEATWFNLSHGKFGHITSLIQMFAKVSEATSIPLRLSTVVESHLILLILH